MEIMALIILYDFIQVLNSTRKYYTNNEYFPKHTLFSTIFLLQEEVLNLKNYFEQEINMINFVQATENDVLMYASFVCQDVYEFL
jgi:hypothetical protein